MCMSPPVKPRPLKLPITLAFPRACFSRRPVLIPDSSMEWMYVSSITLTKFALLLLYLRVFSTSHRFRTAIYCLGVTVVLWAVALYLVLTFQCRPISAAWAPWIAPKQCLSIKWIQVGNAVPNITTDLIILSLPVTQMPKLKVSFIQKVSLCFAFMLGGL